MTEQENSGLLLSGLDGANPLAFLAALGTLRGLTLAWPERSVCLSWTLPDTWRPCLHVDGDTPGEEETLDGLEAFMQMRPGHEALEIGDNLTVPTANFRTHARNAALAASPSPKGRSTVDFMAAFGCDLVESADRKGQIQDTGLRTMSGTGHQHFLKTMRDLAEKAGRSKLQQCLFGSWERKDPQLSLRWDPEDDRRYALQWKNPSDDKVSVKGEKSGAPTEWGANRLAFEALPLFPVMPVLRGVQTTGFSGTRSRNTFWTWPIWDVPVGLDTLRSLLALPELQSRTIDHERLGAMGIRQVFKSRRITIGQYRNFTPSTPE